MNDATSNQPEEWLYQACLVEVLSDKPGNVSPGKDFHDATVADFIRSAQVAAPQLAMAPDIGVGRAIYEAVVATHNTVGHNTNLGILLLLGPLAAVPLSIALADGLPDILNGLTVEDADWAFRAIRIAEPGGLGKAESQDVSDSPTETLLECMQLAADRDLIACQYVTTFDDVLKTGVDWLLKSASNIPEVKRIGWVALRLMAVHGDSLVARKCGLAASLELQQRAAGVLEAGWPHTGQSEVQWQTLDKWLRSDGNQLNPGTTADMIAAIVFAAIRSGQYQADPNLLQNHPRQATS